MGAVSRLAFRAPGRVTLIGDHTDYNDGFVLPAAIQLECVVRGRTRDDRIVRVRSRDAGGGVRLPADGSAAPAAVEPPWGRYVAGVVRTLAELGRPPVGIDALVSSSVPRGGGLSSSAALEVSVALALCAAAGFEPELLELANACRRAEEIATGVPCGIMDQLASLAGRHDHALLIDCRSLEVEPIPVPSSLAVLVVHSGVPRGLAGSAYADRRRACEAIASRLGLAALRDATPEQVADEPLGRHVVSESARVVDAAEALRTGDVDALGPLLVASHASLRDDYRVSTPELDALVDALVDAGALGARLTGAGFGGSVVALAPQEDATAVLESATTRYRSETGKKPRGLVSRPADGAGSLA